MVRKPARSPKQPHDPARRKERGLLAVSTSLPKVAAPALRKRGFAEARLITDWPAIAGDMLARETVPQKLVFPRGTRSGGTLHLRVSSGFALELQHIAPQLIDRINGFFGFGAVADLRFAQGPIPAQRRPRRVRAPVLPAPQEARLAGRLAEIDDPELRAALQRLGRAVGTGGLPGAESG